VPEDLNEWRQLRGDALVDRVMTSSWYAQPNDLVGGWCVMPVDLPPSSGFFEVADFCDERIARYVAKLHNDALERLIFGTRS